MFILVHAQRGMCFDLVSETFPVAEPLVWVNVAAYPITPQYGWLAAQEEGVWVFTDPDPQPTP